MIKQWQHKVPVKNVQHLANLLTRGAVLLNKCEPFQCAVQTHFYHYQYLSVAHVLEYV